MQTSIALMKWSVGRLAGQVNSHSGEKVSSHNATADNNQLFSSHQTTVSLSLAGVGKPETIPTRVPDGCARNICLCTRLIRICED